MDEVLKPSQELPNDLIGALRYFSDPDRCLKFAMELRWPDGPQCPVEGCESRELSFLSTRRIWKCRRCKKQFSVKVGTIFEDSPICLEKWMAATWFIANCKNGVSS